MKRTDVPMTGGVKFAVEGTLWVDDGGAVYINGMDLAQVVRTLMPEPVGDHPGERAANVRIKFLDLGRAFDVDR